jgi:hypothetical protein
MATKKNVEEFYIIELEEFVAKGNTVEDAIKELERAYSLNDLENPVMIKKCKDGSLEIGKISSNPTVIWE